MRAEPQGRSFITGASGFIGSHLVELMLARGAAVRCCQHVTPIEPVNNRVEVVRADLCDAQEVHKAVEGTSTVFHLGGMASVAAAQASPREACRINTIGTLNVLNAARDCGVAHVVLLSTAHVYGRGVHLPVTESHPLAPSSIYASAKLAADILGLGYYRSFGLPVTVLRPFNVYGPRQNAVAVIPEIITQALAGGPIRVQDLSPRRDFLFVEDVADALLRAAGNPAAAGQEVILASGQAVSIASLVRRVITLANAAAEPPEEPADNSDCFFGDPAKAREILAWCPQTDLDSGLRRTIAWWRSQSLRQRSQTGTPAREAFRS